MSINFNFDIKNFFIITLLCIVCIFLICIIIVYIKRKNKYIEKDIEQSFRLENSKSIQTENILIAEYDNHGYLYLNGYPSNFYY